MIAAADGAAADGTLRIGFHARLDPGWHLYWRTPGETGLPTQFDFSASQNVADVAIDWPTPTRASLLGYNAWVYSDEVVLPMTVLDLPGRATAATPYAALIARFDARVPSKTAGGPLDVTRISATDHQVTLEVRSATPMVGLDAAVEGPLEMAFGAPVVTYGADRRSAVIGIPMELVGTKRPSRRDLVVTVMDGDRADARRRVVSTAR